MILYNNTKLDETVFSGGEVHVKLSPNLVNMHNSIIADMYSSEEIIRVAMLVDAIRQIMGDKYHYINLGIKYLPYARQDRVCNKGEAFSLKVMANFINSMNLDKVFIYDAHSDVALQLINNSENIGVDVIINNTDLYNKIEKDNCVLVTPDKGAKKRVKFVQNLFENNPPKIVQCYKVRDQETRNIISTEIAPKDIPFIEGNNMVIVDDICDGGRTFIEVSKLLKSHGALSVTLYTTHGIYSNGIEYLKDHFNEVYCYHTMSNEAKQSEFVRVLS